MTALLRPALALLAALLLPGCASVFLVDNQVESFARWQERAPNAGVPAAPQLYRFERLPSQQDERSARSQDELERYAEAALTQRGWTRAALPACTARRSSTCAASGRSTRGSTATTCSRWTTASSCA